MLGSRPLNVLILRDPRESPKKCSLIPLKGKPGFRFVEFDRDAILDAQGMTLLDPEGPPLSSADAGRPLLVLDSSWRHLHELRRTLRGEVFPRSIPPGFVTAYPRKSKLFEDPASGLASVEALFLACALLGERREDLLEKYYWRESFLELNRSALSRI